MMSVSIPCRNGLGPMTGVRMSLWGASSGVWEEQISSEKSSKIFLSPQNSHCQNINFARNTNRLT